MGRDRAYLVVCCLLLLVATLAVYSRVRNNPFASFDDLGYVTRNPHVRAGLTWPTIVWAWTSTEQSNWHPLTWMSHALDCQMYGLNPSAHHWTSVGMHVLNVLLLFLLLLKVTGKPWRSLLVAALFALHPFNVESVAWVAERKNVLSTLLFLLTLAAYGWYARRPGVKRYLLVAVAFALALTAKPMVITLPFVLLLLDFWPLGRMAGWETPAQVSGKRKGRKTAEPVEQSAAFVVPQYAFSRLLLEKLPLLLLSVLSAVLTVIAQGSAGSIQSFTKLPLEMRIENAIGAYAMYVWMAFWPTRLAVYYPLLGQHFPTQELALPGWRLALAGVFLLTLTAVVWQQRFAKRYLVTGWLFYLGTLVPVIGVIQVGDQSMADRYAYVPLLGVFVMVVWALADWADAGKVPWPWRAAPAAMVLAALSLLTWRQIGFWSSNYAMWSRALQVTNNNLLAEINFADALRELGRSNDALAHVQRAAELNPPDPNLHVRLAATLAECGRFQEAVAEYQTTIRLTQNPRITAPSYESLAILYAALGDFEKERESYREALQMEPRIAPLMIHHARQEVERNPTAVGYLSLGMLLQDTGKRDEARDAYRQALKLDSGLAPARDSLSLLEPGPQ